MNAKKFSDALGYVRNEYVSEAITYQCKHKRHSLVKWGSLVACFCMIIWGVYRFSEYTGLAVYEVALAASDIPEISSIYDGTLLVDNLDLANATDAAVKLSYLGKDSDYENADWETLSISADYTEYTMEVNCSFHEEPNPSDDLEKFDTVTYGDITVYLYRAEPTTEFEYIYTAIFEYDGVYYDLATKSNNPDRIYDLISTITGTSQVTNTTVSEKPEDMKVSEIPEGVEKFTNILGFDGYRISVEEGTPSFFIWHYYTEQNGKQVCIAETSGYLYAQGKPDAYSVDLDGDEMPELVCNVVYGTGAERVIVYRNNGGVIEQGTMDQSYYINELGMDVWGSGSIAEKYDPMEGSFIVTNTSSDGNVKTELFNSLDYFIFMPYDSHESNT